jgi:hypothetical protein
MTRHSLVAPLTAGILPVGPCARKAPSLNLPVWEGTTTSGTFISGRCAAPAKYVEIWNEVKAAR